MASATIKTNRLNLTPFDKGHVDARHLSWLNDKTLMRFSEQRHHIHSLESCLAYAKQFEGSPNYYWAIERLYDNHGHIGTINAYVNVMNETADIGILIGASEIHGQGYGLESWHGIIDFLFATCHLRKITAGTMGTNTAMLNIMKRSAMHPEGLRNRQFLDANGAEVDSIHMALFKEDWVREKNKRLI